MGYSYREGSLLLSYVGVSSGFGKMLFGKISDLPFVNIFVLYIVCMILSGVSSLIVIFSTTYLMLVVYSALFGFLDGSFIGLMSIMTFECADPDYMAQAWGGVLMIESLAMLVGPPAAGEFEGKAGSWTWEETGGGGGGGGGKEGEWGEWVAIMFNPSIPKLPIFKREMKRWGSERIVSMIIFHLSKWRKAKFFMLWKVIFLVRL